MKHAMESAIPATHFRKCVLAQVLYWEVVEEGGKEEEDVAAGGGKRGLTQF